MPRAFRWLSVACAFAFLSPGPARAQEQAQVFSYATYLECDPARQGRADTLMKQAWAPVLDRQVAAKRLTNWGWLAHQTGGPWSRVGFLVAASRDQLLDGRAAVLTDMRARSRAFAELFSICPRHEDYIWRRLVTSRAARTSDAGGSAARSSVYYECNPARDARADTLVVQVFGPIFDRQVEAEALQSWSWHQHALGGKYRRLLILEGDNHKAILTAIDSVLATNRRERPAESREFNEICYSHQDYLWDVQLPRRQVR
jgi:hypothetical protein